MSLLSERQRRIRISRRVGQALASDQARAAERQGAITATALEQQAYQPSRREINIELEQHKQLVKSMRRLPDGSIHEAGEKV